MKLHIRVKEIKGTCPIYEGDEEFEIDCARLKILKGDGICIHSLPTILHFSMALREGGDPVEIGLAKEGGKAYVQCPDPGEPYTCGAPVVFEIEPRKN